MSSINEKYPSQCSYRGEKFITTTVFTKPNKKHNEHYHFCNLKDETIMCKRRYKAEYGQVFCVEIEEE